MEDRAREWLSRGIREGWRDTVDRLAATFARTSTHRLARLASVDRERFQPSGLLVELAPYRARQRRERLEDDAPLLDAPRPSLQRVASR